LSIGSKAVTHEPALFVADAVGLDFLNSIATPVDVPVDWIADGAGFLNWLEQARLVPRDVLASMRARARPGELDRVAARARELREWFRTFVLRHAGAPLVADIAELAPLNELLARDQSHAVLVVHDDADAAAHFAIERRRRWTSPETLLLPIGEALAEVVASEDFADIKACEGPVCTLLFVDHTRGRARRWCSMAICGNRAKQAAHRRRRKAAKPR